MSNTPCLTRMNSHLLHTARQNMKCTGWFNPKGSAFDPMRATLLVGIHGQDIQPLAADQHLNCTGILYKCLNSKYIIIILINYIFPLLYSQAIGDKEDTFHKSLKRYKPIASASSISFMQLVIGQLTLKDRNPFECIPPLLEML